MAFCSTRVYRQNGGHRLADDSSGIDGAWLRAHGQRSSSTWLMVAEGVFRLNLLAYGVLHAGRCVMEEPTGTRLESAPRARAVAADGQPEWSAVGGGGHFVPSMPPPIGCGCGASSGTRLGIRLMFPAALQLARNGSLRGVLFAALPSARPNNGRRGQSCPLDR